mgnify:FL=1
MNIEKQDWKSIHQYIYNKLSNSKVLNILDILEDIFSEAYYIALFKDVCFAVEKPIRIKLKNDQYHCENGSAVEFEDGDAYYFLNNIKVPKELVLTPKEKLDPSIYLSDKNVEVRREFIRIYGIENLKIYGTVIDKKTYTRTKEQILSVYAEHYNYKIPQKLIDNVNNLKTFEFEYELVDMAIPSNKNLKPLFTALKSAPYLFMKNPSIEAYHAEAVPEGTKTVEDALIFRNGTTEFPLILT